MLSSALVFLGIVEYVNKKKIAPYILFFFGFSMHYSAIIIVVPITLYILCYRKERPKRFVIAMMSIGLVCYVLYSIGHYIVSRYFARRHFMKLNMVDAKLTVLISAVLILSSYLVKYIFPYAFIRYTVLLIFGIGLIQKKDYIIRLLIRREI